MRGMFCKCRGRINRQHSAVYGQQASGTPRNLRRRVASALGRGSWWWWTARGRWEPAAHRQSLTTVLGRLRCCRASAAPTSSPPRLRPSHDGAYPSHSLRAVWLICGSERRYEGHRVPAHWLCLPELRSKSQECAKTCPNPPCVHPRRSQAHQLLCLLLR